MAEEFSLAAYRHSVDIQVRFSDFDLQEHVSNTVYQTYYDYGKQDYFDLVIGTVDWKVRGVVSAAIKIDYLKPIYQRTRIAVKTRVTRIGNKSITFEHCIINSDNDELMSICTAILVCFDHVKRQSILVPEQWRKNIMIYEGMI
jgi:acyl-CoA thioester hydrolase